MRRRDFISIIAATATAGLFAARTQAEQVRRIGVLMGMDAHDPVGQSEVRALKQGLTNWGGSKAATCKSSSTGQVVSSITSKLQRRSLLD